MFNERHLQVLQFAVQFLISNLNAETDDLLRTSCIIPQETEKDLESLKSRIEYKLEQTKVRDGALDAAKAATVRAYPDWQTEVEELVDRAKHTAVENLNYEYAAHWRDVGREFAAAMSRTTKWYACLQDLENLLPANSALTKLVTTALNATGGKEEDDD